MLTITVGWPQNTPISNSCSLCEDISHMQVIKISISISVSSPIHLQHRNTQFYKTNIKCIVRLDLDTLTGGGGGNSIYHFYLKEETLEWNNCFSPSSCSFFSSDWLHGLSVCWLSDSFSYPTFSHSAGLFNIPSSFSSHTYYYHSPYPIMKSLWIPHHFLRFFLGL